MSQENLTIEAPTEETGPGYNDQGQEDTLPPLVPPKATGYAGGKFDSVEDLEAAYAELVAKAEAAPQDPAPEADGLDPSQVKDEDLNRDRAAQELAKGELDIADMEAEFLREGLLSEDTYAKLEQKGIQRELVDRYIDANVAQADAFASEVKAIAGGETEYADMAHWAQSNLSPDELASFDSMVTSGDTGLIKLAVQGMATRWREAVGQPPQLVSGSAKAGVAPREGFRSAEEMVQAMRDPRYGKDPAYTHEIEARVGRSNIF